MKEARKLTKEERAKYRKIIGGLSMNELLSQAGEEGAELVQALLKMRRTLPESKNPTPKKSGEIIGNIYEEIADLKICLEAIGFYACNAEVKKWEDYKLKRWAGRLILAKKEKEAHE